MSREHPYTHIHAQNSETHICTIPSHAPIITGIGALSAVRWRDCAVGSSRANSGSENEEHIRQYDFNHEHICTSSRSNLFSMPVWYFSYIYYNRISTLKTLTYTILGCLFYLFCYFSNFSLVNLAYSILSAIPLLSHTQSCVPCVRSWWNLHVMTRVGST